MLNRGTRDFAIPDPKRESQSTRSDKYKLRPQEELYFPALDWDLTFTSEEVKRVIELWKEDKDILEIARAVKRKRAEEVIVLIMDLSCRNRISRRSIGLGLWFEREESGHEEPLPSSVRGATRSLSKNDTTDEIHQAPRCNTVLCLSGLCSGCE